MKRNLIFILFLVVLLLIAFHLFSGSKVKKTKKTHVRLSELQLYPELNKDDTLLAKSGFVTSFNKKHKVPNWAAYLLCKMQVQDAKVERADRFIPEKCVNTATDKDYRKSGYDKGHIVPAKDMAYSEKCMKESFYYSNVCPQEPNFNRGRWKQLEEKVREWAVENDSIFIITGVFSKSCNHSIGINKILVPEYFYKAILDISQPELKAIAFMFENKKTAEPIYKHAITIDSLENFLRIDFFDQLPDSMEKEIESELNLSKWNM